MVGCCNIQLALKDRTIAEEILVVDVDEDLLFDDEVYLPNFPYEHLMYALAGLE